MPVDDERVNFRHRDPIEGTLYNIMTLPAAQFIRRHLLHVLPHGFVRIRHYGLPASRRKAADLARCRNLLSVAEVPETTEPPLVPTTEDRISQLHWKRFHQVPALRPAALTSGIGGTAVGRARPPAYAADLGGVESADIRFQTNSTRTSCKRLRRSCARLAPEEIPLTEAQRTELDRRLDDLEADSDLGIPWEEVLRRIRGRSR